MRAGSKVEGCSVRLGCVRLLSDGFEGCKGLVCDSEIGNDVQ